MVAQTLEDILITDKEVSGYMDSRDNSEHLKIKSPSDYTEEVIKHFCLQFQITIIFSRRKSLMLY